MASFNAWSGYWLRVPAVVLIICSRCLRRATQKFAKKLNLPFCISASSSSFLRLELAFVCQP